jgi:hypothetical protein
VAAQQAVLLCLRDRVGPRQFAYSIRNQSMMDMDMPPEALPTIPVQLESGTPDVLVGTLTVAPTNAATQGGVQESVPRVTLILWRRDSA